MARLTAHGLAADLPAGFEGRIYRRAPIGGAVGYPIAHFCTFPLPADTADFGGSYVDLMAPDDIFAVLAEYGPESVGRALFEVQGLPRRLSAGDFRTNRLRRGSKGQGGYQTFFTEAGRPFTLYVVVGSYARRQALVPRIDGLLAGIEVAAPASGGGPVIASPAGAKA